jgi:hypothetical protein
MRHWENFECEFSTCDAEKLENFKSYVWRDLVLRDGPAGQPINPANARNNHAYVAYMWPSDARRFVAFKRFVSKEPISIAGVSGASVIIAPRRECDHRTETFTLCRLPKKGRHPFYFSLSNGKIVNEHIGDPITELIGRPPLIAPPPRRRYAKLNGCCVM